MILKQSLLQPEDTSRTVILIGPLNRLRPIDGPVIAWHRVAPKFGKLVTQTLTRNTPMAINVIVPESARKTYESWHFAPAVRHDDLIFFSGAVGHGDSAEEEFRNAWASLGDTLTEAGVGELS